MCRYLQKEQGRHQEDAVQGAEVGGCLACSRKDGLEQEEQSGEALRGGWVSLRV